MKRIKRLILCLVAFVIMTPVCYAGSSNFTTDMIFNTDITDNQIKLFLRNHGEEVNYIKSKLAYDNRYLKINNIYESNGAEITYTSSNDGNWTIIDLEIDSEEMNTDDSFAIVTFKVMDAFTNNKLVRVFLYDNEAKGNEGYKYRYTGVYVNLSRQDDFLNFSKYEITKKTEIEYWFIDHTIHIAVGCGIFLLIIILILIKPSRPKERIKSKKNEIKSNVNVDKFTLGNDFVNQDNELSTNDEVDAFNSKIEDNTVYEELEDDIEIPKMKSNNNEEDLFLYNPQFEDKK